MLCVALQFPHYLNRNSIKNCTQIGTQSILGLKVPTIVEKIADMNAPIHYNARHNYANCTRKSSRLINHRCECTIITTQFPHPMVYPLTLICPVPTPRYKHPPVYPSLAWYTQSLKGSEPQGYPQEGLRTRHTHSTQKGSGTRYPTAPVDRHTHVKTFPATLLVGYKMVEGCPKMGDQLKSPHQT